MALPTRKRYEASRFRVQPIPLAAQDLLELLQGVRRNGEGRWMARCPAHGDKGPSLSIREGDDGRILLHDFGGCSLAEIADALGIQVRQLFPASDTPWKPTKPRRDPERDTWALVHRLRALHRPKEPERFKRELRFVGKLILGGTGALAKVPPTFKADCLVFPLRILFQAMQELGKQGKPCLWFSPLAMAREVDWAAGRRGAGRERFQVFLWARMAVGAARCKP